jgi:hypothetical protein
MAPTVKTVCATTQGIMYFEADGYNRFSPAMDIKDFIGRNYARARCVDLTDPASWILQLLHHRTRSSAAPRHQRGTNATASPRSGRGYIHCTFGSTFGGGRTVADWQLDAP